MTVAQRQEVHRTLRTTALVALAALVSVAPYVYYLTSVAFADRLRDRFGADGLGQLLRAELASIGLVVIIAALVGTGFSKRYGLPGLGSRALVRRAAYLVLGVAPVLSLLTYSIFGRAIAERVPGYYPDDLVWAAARTFKGALFDEVVARFGMMTIICGIVRRIWLANVLQAVFFTGLATLGLSFYGVQATADAYFVASLLSSVAIHLILGAVHARYGLVAAMLFHWVYDLRYPLHALLS